MGSWSYVWKTLLPENIKIFLWLAFHESLLTNLLCVKLHVVVVCSCCKCGTLEESFLHIF
uniref:Reverse transcriptase zinc-binding domain-containing protein n=1 Tax=Cajanus cajan TaxID=3821 RepID=A0A151S6Y1_CAJCA|nr:hypothetical protein KK1_027695 [Cajanus cajan]